MDPSRRLPDHMVEHVRAYADGSRTPAEPRNAATVALLRRGASGGPGSLEVYLLRRHLEMPFAGGMAVFPGGGVDPRDFEREVGWAGPPPADWARALGTEEPLARALVCAAVRETFEESGVLFAGETADTVVDDVTGESWEEDRHRLEARELSLTDFLRDRGLQLRTDLLRVWGTWLTPVFEPRRYRTWFFVAELPPGQRTRDVSTESTQVEWLSVRQALTAAHERQILMLPPQYCTCLELFDCATPAEALAAATDRAAAGHGHETVQPTAVLDDEGAYLQVPKRLVDLGGEIRRRLDREGAGR